MKILLVNMPCSSIRPPLGVSLLKSLLGRDGHEVTVFNANIDFANRVGSRYYHYLAEVAPVEVLLGEYLFADVLFEGRSTEPYLDFLATDFDDECPALARELLAKAKLQVEPHLHRCLEFVEADDYEFVGFTSSFTQHMASLSLARMIKERRPQVITAFGGANCEDEMGLALHNSFPFVDLVFCGEADVSLPQAVAALTAGESLVGIRGVISRNPKRGTSRYTSLSPERIQNLDLLPYPDYDDFFEQYASMPSGSRTAGVPMETSRGCWWGEKHHCTFCGLNGLSMAFRAKSPERALAELDYLQHRYEVEDIQMVDNILDMRYVKTFLPMLAERPVRPALFYETKANLTWDQLLVFQSAGIRAIQAGIESLDTRVLKLMDKGTTGVRAVELLRQCREAGIWPHWNILYGFPGEPPDAYEAMAEKVEWLAHLDPPNVCVQFRLDRFSPLYLRADELGLTAVRPARAYQLLYALPEERVRQLAYYFDFSYGDGRCPDSYTAGLREAVADWQRRPHGDLTHERVGDELRIVDSRSGGRRELALAGAEADLYRACDRATPLVKLVEELGPRLGADRVGELLAEWVERRVMLELDGRFLALAVDAAAAKCWRRRRKPSWRKVLDESLRPARPRVAVAGGLFSS
jgi:ribosomal peptide maturation radical SAM protein 1